MLSLPRMALWLLAASCLSAAFPEAAARFGALPPAIELNRGQAAPGVYLLARLGGYTAYFEQRQVRLLLAAGRQVRVVFEGAGANGRPEGEGRLRSSSNYFVGNNPRSWRSGVPHFRAVRYRRLYSGVDAIFYIAGRQLEYDLELAPGTEPARIRLRFDGADWLGINADGDLEVRAGGSVLVQRKPAAYQPQGLFRRALECRYRLAGPNRVALEVSGYDRRLPLVIDPVLVYATYFGTGTNDNIIGIKVDAAGMVYFAGYTSSSDLASSPDSIQTANAGKRDIFVAKLDPRREPYEALVYLTYLGGSEADTPTAMEVDASGNVYLTGWTQSTDFPLAGNAPQIQRAGETGQDAFLVKLNPGVAGPLGLLFSTYLGGSDSDTGYGVAVDEKGYVYVVGVTKSEDFPVTQRVLQRGRWGDQDGFVVWLDPQAADPASAVLYASYLGGEYNDEARAVAALEPGMVAVSGETSSVLYHVSGDAFRPSYQGGGDVFVSVLDLRKPEYDALVYSTYLGGTGSEAPRRMLRDQQGRLVIVGYTLSSDFPTTPDGFQPQPRRAGQVFLTILDPKRAAGEGLIYSTYFGGSGGEVAYDVTLDAKGRIYLTGYTLSRDFPLSRQAFQSDYGEGVEAFCTVLDPRAPGAAGLIYSTYLGRTGINVGYGIAVSAEGTIYVGGSVQDRAFPVTETALQGAHAGGLADGFIVALKPDETGLNEPHTISMQSP